MGGIKDMLSPHVKTGGGIHPPHPPGIYALELKYIARSIDCNELTLEASHCDLICRNGNFVSNCCIYGLSCFLINFLNVILTLVLKSAICLLILKQFASTELNCLLMLPKYSVSCLVLPHSGVL